MLVLRLLVAAVAATAALEPGGFDEDAWEDSAEAEIELHHRHGRQLHSHDDGPVLTAGSNQGWQVHDIQGNVRSAAISCPTRRRASRFPHSCHAPADAVATNCPVPCFRAANSAEQPQLSELLP